MFNGSCPQGGFMKIRFICDPSHGWGEVPMSLINELGIGGEISSFSYRKGGNAYLEEDCDLSLFLNEMQKQGRNVAFLEEHSNYDSWVRNLPNYYYGEKV
jgi:hypothetical protein